MKTMKKLTAILLVIATLTALFILPAAAADGTGASVAESHYFMGTAENMKIELPKPNVTVTNAEGETVYELALDFTPDGTSEPMLLDCADLSKIIALHVYYDGVSTNFKDLFLKPKTFNAETGVLTVSLLNYAGEAGFLLHDLVFTFDGKAESMFLFDLKIPVGLLYSSQDASLQSAESSYACGYLCDVDGMPIRIGAVFTTALPHLTPLYSRIPDGIRRIIPETVFIVLLSLPLFIIQLPAVIRSARALHQSFFIYSEIELAFRILLTALSNTLKNML
ncbi:MAG: hypothetical protein IJT41_02730 [Clostridia bacterium]|nr:hypothetical protein [Clostridia bacterium]